MINTREDCGLLFYQVGERMEGPFYVREYRSKVE